MGGEGRKLNCHGSRHTSGGGGRQGVGVIGAGNLREGGEKGVEGRISKGVEAK